MTTADQSSSDGQEPPNKLLSGAADALFRVVKLLALLYIFLVSIQLIGDSFRLLGGGSASTLFSGIDNPFLALMIGLLTTAILQSSSTTTSITVGLVAVEAISLEVAIPMIMGANIGTSVTNTIVSMGHVRDKEEFKRAFAGATVHDVFNIMTVAILLPVEIATGMLQKLSTMLLEPLQAMGGASFDSPLKAIIKPAGKLFVQIDKAQIKKAALGQPTDGPLLDGGIIDAAGLGDQASGGLLLAIAITLMVLALMGIVRTLKTVVEAKAADWLRGALDKNAVVSMGIGAGATVAVQSSSITTSTLVPMVGVGLVTLEAMFPLTLGANVGTTVTALLASMGASGSGAALGLQIAVCHLLFNLIGILMIYPVRRLRQVPLNTARWLAGKVVERPAMAFVYIGVVFFAIPGISVGIYELFVHYG